MINIVLKVFQIFHCLIDLIFFSGYFTMLLMSGEIDRFPEIEDIQQEANSQYDQCINTPNHHVLVSIFEY